MTALARFHEKTRRAESGCLEWLGATNSRGYGSFSFGGKGKNVLAHRWIYEATVGPIATEMTIDHICRNRRCVDVKHLEVVTRGENTRRSRAIITHCKRGHPLSGDNIVWKKGRRNCLVCKREAQRRAWQRTTDRQRSIAPLPKVLTEDTYVQ